MQSRIKPFLPLIPLVIVVASGIVAGGTNSDECAVLHVGEQGFLSSWLKLGPFPQKKGRTPEELARTDPLGAASIRIPPRRGQFNKKGTWETHFSKRRAVDLSGQRSAIVHLAAVLEPQDSGRYWLATGSNGPLTVWLNGTRVLYREVDRKSSPDTDLTALDLKPGANLLILKLATDRPRRWRLHARLLDRAFEPARDVSIVLPGGTSSRRRLIAQTGVVTLARSVDLKTAAVSVRAAVRFAGAVPKLDGVSVTAHFIGGGAPPPLDMSVDAAGLENGRIDIGEFQFTGDVAPHTIAVEVDGAAFRARTGFRMRDVKKLAAAYADFEKGKHHPGLPKSTVESVEWRVAHLRRLIESGDEDFAYLSGEIGNTARMARLIAAGEDPYHDRRAQVQRRGYRSSVDGRLHYYALYVPPWWREQGDKQFGLVIALHGLHATPMKAMQAVFGRPMDEDETREHKERHPKPIDGGPFFVLAPEGFGSSGYRAYGEVDVLEALAQVMARYRIDPDRIYITGTSMGGIGSASLSLHYPDRFAAAAPLAGYHSQFLHSSLKGREFSPWERFLLEGRSNAAWAVNARHLPFLIVHGLQDGPMHSRVLADRLRQLEYDVTFETPDAGHNVWDETYKDRRIFQHFKPLRRTAHPRQLSFRTANLRYPGTHWLRVDEMANWHRWAGFEAEWGADQHVSMTTENLRAFTVTRDPMLGDGHVPRFTVDNQALDVGDGRQTSWSFQKTPSGWRAGKPSPCKGYCKRPGLSGPIGDAFYEPLMFVYGTLDPVEETIARRVIASMRVPHYGITVRWPVKADRDVTEEDIAKHALVLVGTPTGNALLKRIADQLPIRIDKGAVVVGDRRFEGPTVAAAFIHPNPLNPARYVVVHTGLSKEALFYADHLPGIVPDYVVYDGATWQWKGGKVLRDRRALATGFFDSKWRVVSKTRSGPKDR